MQQLKQAIIMDLLSTQITEILTTTEKKDSVAVQYLQIVHQSVTNQDHFR